MVEEKKAAVQVKKDDVSKLKSLGSGATSYATMSGVDAVLLECFPNKFPHRNYVIKFHSDEVTSLCPKTGQPDFAKITVEYTPDELCVESKGLKLYLGSYRSQATFMETMTNNILEHLVGLVKPRWMKVTGDFAARGGIGMVVVAEYKAPTVFGSPGPA